MAELPARLAVRFRGLHYGFAGFHLKSGDMQYFGFEMPDGSFAYPYFGLEMPDGSLAYPYFGFEMPDGSFAYPYFGFEMPIGSFSIHISNQKIPLK